MGFPEDLKSEKPGYSRRCRTNFTNAQLRELENMFGETKYPNCIVTKELASTLHLDESVIKTWFKNRRNRWKKQQKQTQPTVPQEAPTQMAPVKVEKTLFTKTAAESPLRPGILDAHGPDIHKNSGTEQPEGAGASICSSSWDSQPYAFQDACLGCCAPSWASIPCDIDQFVERYALPGEDDPRDFDQYLFPRQSR